MLRVKDVPDVMDVLAVVQVITVMRVQAAVEAIAQEAVKITAIIIVVVVKDSVRRIVVALAVHIVTVVNLAQERVNARVLRIALPDVI